MANVKRNNKNINTTTTKPTQCGMVLKYLRLRRKRLTADEVAAGIKQTYGLTYTPTRVTMCLSTLKIQGKVISLKGGLTRTGRACLRWKLNTTTSA